MADNFKILIVDDHPLIAEAYKNALEIVESEDEHLEFAIDMAHDIDSAVEIMTIAHQQNGLDLIFLDIKLPHSKESQFLSGEDLGIEVQRLFPKIKIIISTTFNDNYRVYNILKNVNPDGFLVKNDITPEQLVLAIKSVLSGSTYYSDTILELMRKQISSDFVLDRIDRQLLYELSNGTKMKDLPSILPLSIAGIERRKRHLKEIFDVDKHDDGKLVAIAREKGFI